MKKEIPPEVFTKHGLNSSRLNSQDLLLPPLLETKEMKAILQETGKWVGIAAANLVTIFNPSLLILGGELPKTGEEFTKAVIKTMKMRILNEFTRTVKVVSSTMEKDPPLIGAYTLALEALFAIENWY